eukprot:TRINITY_DN14669_c0_g1_i1.p1 TRINITY_DN14669_c0_g1~~TRINITY_DN14669_c0_g1_i1.p1  ORF type:complete len:155 (+),score=0.54 TRINITY_DN14669_c0_g1_i1:48-467(+)
MAELFLALEIDDSYCEVFQRRQIQMKDLQSMPEVDFFNMMPNTDQRIRLLQFINKHFSSTSQTSYFKTSASSYIAMRALTDTLGYSSDSGDSSVSIHVNSDDSHDGDLNSDGSSDDASVNMMLQKYDQPDWPHVSRNIR